MIFLQQQQQQQKLIFFSNTRFPSPERTQPLKDHSRFINSPAVYWDFGHASSSPSLPHRHSCFSQSLPTAALSSPQYQCAPQANTTRFMVWKQSWTKLLAAKTEFYKDSLSNRTCPLSCPPESLGGNLLPHPGPQHMTKCAQLAGKEEQTTWMSGFGLWTIKDSWKAKVFMSVRID